MMCHLFVLRNVRWLQVEVGDELSEVLPLLSIHVNTCLSVLLLQIELRYVVPLLCLDKFYIVHCIVF